jgi:hypothetical protein
MAAAARPKPSSPNLRPSDFARLHLSFHPDDSQTAALDSTAKRGILLCTRQWGKSSVLAAKAIHRAYTVPNSLILVASPTERQSRLFLQKAAEFLAALDVRACGDGHHRASLRLPTGSRIVALPGTEATIRGFSAASMILIDEAARVRNSVYLALQPMLAVSNGDLWLLSTPCGKTGFFYDAWTNGRRWERHSVRATECPRISPEWLELQREEMPAAWFRQEYLCEFVDNEDSFFPRGLVESALTEEGLPI